MQRGTTRRRHGQSVPLIVLLMLVLIGSVGLSVDVGNAYGQQRRMQNAANAGALAGANAVSETQANGLRNWTNADIWAQIQTALAGNRVVTNGTAYEYRAEYVLKDRSTQALASYPGVAPNLSKPPTNVMRVRVLVAERVETFFVRAVGRDNFTVYASADACVGQFGAHVMPIGIPLQLDPYRTAPGNSSLNSNAAPPIRTPVQPTPTAEPLPTAQPTPTPLPEPFDRVYNDWVDVTGNGPTADDLLGAFVPPTTPGWGDWGGPRDTTPPFMLNKVAYLPIENKAPGTPGSHVAWLDWTGGGNAQNELSRELTLPGTLGDGFTEGSQTANPYKNNVVELEQDWVNGFTGVKGGDADKVSDLLGVRILLPIYESAQGNGGNVQYRWQQTGLFKIIGFELASLNSNSAKNPRGLRPPNADGKYLMLEYLGDASEGLATNCSTTAP